jgi:hypothetical protein
MDSFNQRFNDRFLIKPSINYNQKTILFMNVLDFSW